MRHVGSKVHKSIAMLLRLCNYLLITRVLIFVSTLLKIFIQNFNELTFFITNFRNVLANISIHMINKKLHNLSSIAMDLCTFDPTCFKSELLKLVPQRGLAQFLQAPSRFGKSTALQTIKTFFEIRVDASGNRLPKSANPNHKCFTQIPRYLKRKLPISKDEQFVDTHFGAYPVVFMDFKSITVPVSEKSLVRDLHGLLLNSFLEHEYLVNSDKCPARATLKSYFFEDKSVITMQELHNVVSNYLQCLRSHHDKPVIILVDGFDTPAGKFIVQDENPDVKLLAKLLGNFVCFLLKGNPRVFCAFMTGITRYGEVHSRDVNIKHEAIFLSPAFASYYGLNETKVNALCERFGQLKLCASIKNRLSGCCVHGHEWKLFNTVSVIGSLKRNKVWDSLAKLGFSVSVRRLLKFENLGEDLWHLMQNKLLNLQIRNITAGEIKQLKVAILGACRLDKDLALQYLLENCFLVRTNASELMPPTSVNLYVPNKEGKNALMASINDAATTKYYHLEPFFQKALDAMVLLQPNKESCQRFVDAIAALVLALPRTTKMETELQLILNAIVFFYKQTAYVEVPVSYHPAKEPGSPGIHFAFLVKNPSTPENFTYSLVECEVKYGEHFNDTELKQSGGRGNRRVGKENEELAGKKIIHYYHLSEEGKVMAEVLYDDENAIKITSKLPKIVASKPAGPKRS